MILINPDQRIELTKPNQGMGLNNSNQYIQSYKTVRCSIVTYSKTLNREIQYTQ